MAPLSRTPLHSYLHAAGLSGPDVEKLIELTHERQLKKRQELHAPGKVCRTIYFIERGYFRSFVIKDGEEINIDFKFENEFVADLKSMRSSLPSELTIQAGEDSIVHGFDSEQLRILYSSSPGIASFGIQVVEHLLMAQEEHAALFKLYSATERYRHVREKRPEIIERVSLTQMASYLNVARETLSRIRKVR